MTTTTKRERVVVADNVGIRFSIVDATTSSVLTVVVDPDGDIVLTAGSCKLYLRPEHVPAVIAALGQAMAEAMTPVAPVAVAGSVVTMPEPQPLVAVNGASNDF